MFFIISTYNNDFDDTINLNNDINSNKICNYMSGCLNTNNFSNQTTFVMLKIVFNNNLFNLD